MAMRTYSHPGTGNNSKRPGVLAGNAREPEVGHGTVVDATRRPDATATTVPPDNKETDPLGRPPFGDVARQHLDRLYGFCIHLAGHPSDAEDLLQETLLRAMRSYGELQSAARARGWLFAIATNVWRDQLRSRSRRIQSTSLDALAEGDTEFSLFATIAIEDPFPYSDELHLDFLRLFRDEDVQSVFGTINPSFRLPLILTVIHGFSCKEAAAILDVPLGTVLSRLHRGRK